jgi:hypothetical protein
MKEIMLNDILITLKVNKNEKIKIAGSNVY